MRGDPEHPFDAAKFAAWVEEHRELTGFSNKQMSEHFGLAVPHFQRIVRGTQFPSFVLYGHMVRVAGVPFTAWVRDSLLRQFAATD